MKRIFFVLIVLAIQAVPAFSQDMPPALVVTENVAKQSVAMTSPFVGKVEFDKISNVVTEVPGKVVSLSVTEGSFVRKGDLLAEVDTELLESNLNVLRNEIEEARLKLENSSSRLGRAQDLFDRGIISRQTYDDEFYTNKTLEKQVDTLSSRLANQEIVLAKSSVYAPFDGLVTEKLLDVGEWAKPESPVCTIASTADVYVSVAVPEDIVRYVSNGDRLSLRIDALGKELEGTVMGIVPVAEQVSRNYTVKVRVAYMKNMLQNMSALVHVPVGPKMELSVIKRAALVGMQGKNFVYTVKDGKAAILPVNIVAYLGDFVGVDDPYIVAGMPVVVVGNERLRPDQPVTISGGK